MPIDKRITGRSADVTLRRAATNGERHVAVVRSLTAGKTPSSTSRRQIVDAHGSPAHHLVVRPPLSALAYDARRIDPVAAAPA